MSAGREPWFPPSLQVEVEDIARTLDSLEMRHTAGRVRALLGPLPDDERACAVQDRSPGGVRAIPWGLAEILYPAYGQHHDQTLERLHERGGFGRLELGRLAVDSYHRDDDRRPGGLRRWPLLDLYDMARRNATSHSQPEKPTP